MSADNQSEKPYAQGVASAIEELKRRKDTLPEHPPKQKLIVVVDIKKPKRSDDSSKQS